VHDARDAWDGISHRLGHLNLVVTVDRAMARHLPRLCRSFAGARSVVVAGSAFVAFSRARNPDGFFGRLSADVSCTGVCPESWLSDPLFLCATIGSELAEPVAAAPRPDYIGLHALLGR